jgi:hypothetical protein
MWVGGLAAFFTVVFAVKTLFVREKLITPALRVAACFLCGLLALMLASGVVLLSTQSNISYGAQKRFVATGHRNPCKCHHLRVPIPIYQLTLPSD